MDMLPVRDAWQLIRSGGPIDAMQFLLSLRETACSKELDTRSRLLIRDGLAALEQHWGSGVLNRRLQSVTFPHRSDTYSATDAQEGFYTLGDRIVDATDPNSLLQMLRELGTRVTAPAKFVIGGSLALMIDALIIRHTDDVDLVDEIPATLRNEHELLAELCTRYGLKITHFQSHYLPAGWNQRVRSLGVFGRITVMRVDPIDVLVGKLFSRRAKDLDDNRQAWPLIDQSDYRQRLCAEAKRLSGEVSQIESARHNWYILTGESDLPKQ